MKRSVEPMPIIVFDLELNQPSEKIIEIGYVIGDLASLEIKERQSIIVNPNESLAPEIITLTGISQDEVNNGQSLAEAYQKMVSSVNHHNAKPILFQWGVGDAHLLKSQLPSDIEWPFGRRWIDVKALAQVDALMNGYKVYGGLKKMAARRGIIVDGEKAHRADYDAEMTFKLLGEFSYGLIHEKRLESLKNSRKR